MKTQKSSRLLIYKGALKLSEIFLAEDMKKSIGSRQILKTQIC